MKKLIYIIVFAALLCSCGRDESAADRKEVRRLDLAMRQGRVPADSSMRHAAEVLFAVSGYGELSDSAAAAYAFAPFITLSAQAMDSLWGTDPRGSEAMLELERGLGKMSARFGERLPDVKLPQIYSVVSPFNQSVFTVDTLMFLGLNHYLGAGFEPYAHFPDFIARRKVKERILPDVAEALVRRDYPFKPAAEYPTVLSRLLYEGAVVEAVMQLTGLDEKQALGYSDDEWAWLEANEREMWNALAERKMLFSTDAMTADMLVTLSPVTTALHSESPGYAGRYVGHRVVRSYMKNHDVTLGQLLSPDFYDNQRTLPEAGY